MAQMVRCPLTGEPCGKSIDVVEKTFFLAEPKEPEEDRNRRGQALNLALGDEYTIRSALEERQPYAFTCKICEMIQGCSYGIADISTANLNVILELGMMIALSKPAIILCKRGKEGKLKLPSDLRAIEVIPFSECIDIVNPLREIVVKLPPPVMPLSPIEMTEETLKEVSPQLAQEIRNTLDQHKGELVNQFAQLINEAGLETIARKREEKVEIPPELKERLEKLEESLKDIERVGFITDPETALLRALLAGNRGDWQAVLSESDKYTEFDPHSFQAQFYKGFALIKLGRAEEAIPPYSKALQIKPNHVDTIQSLAEAHLIAGSYDEGLALAKGSEARSKKVGDKCISLFLIVSALLLQGKPADSALQRLLGHLRRLKRRPKLDWDFADMARTLQGLAGPRKDLAFSLIALLSKEIDVDEFEKRHPIRQPRKK